MNVANISRRPLTHLSSFLKKDGGTKRHKDLAFDFDEVRPKAVQLVVSKMRAIANEYDNLLGGDWKRHWAPVIDLLVEEAGGDFQAAAAAAFVKTKADIVMHVIEGRCGLELRFCGPLSQYPWRLAYLVTASPLAQSDQRLIFENQATSTSTHKLGGLIVQFDCSDSGPPARPRHSQAPEAGGKDFVLPHLGSLALCARHVPVGLIHEL